ncbi:MAG: SPOR domain-containing protein [Gammaproteobacteria bacterium]|jgi:cell division protein FtsN|nr:SPOR domain-containing protein [Gammaproteobacteria bacterium]
MTKDYAKRRRSQQSLTSRRRFSQTSAHQSTSMMPAWAWMSVGLILGLGLSGMLYWKLNSPTKPLQAAVLDIQEESPSPEEKTASKRKSTSKPKQLAEANVKDNSSRFDFYTVLPNMNINGPDVADPSLASTSTLDLALSAQTPPPDTLSQDVEAQEQAKLEATPFTEKLPKTPFAYIIQVGSFRSLAQAEELKAQLAFSGFEASIQTFKMGAKDTRYRVFIGPFESKDQADSQQYKLEQAQSLHSVVMKIGV